MGSQSQDLPTVLAIFGFESLGLLWLGVMTGILLRGSWRPPLLSQPALQEIHQATAVLGLTLGATHGIGHLALLGGSTTVLQRHPLLSDWDQRIGTGLAIVGSEVLAAIVLSAIIKRWLGPARWRALHLSSYAAFTLIVAHVLILGPDVTPARVWLPIVGGWLATVALWLATTSQPRTPRPAPSPPTDVLRWMAERQPATRGIAPASTGTAGRLGRPDHGDNPDVTVLVDKQLCTRSGLCEQLAPHVFRLGVEGAVFHRPTAPVDELELVIQAAGICPVRAITLAGRPALPSASPVRIDAPRRSGISAVPGVRRRPAGSRTDR